MIMSEVKEMPKMNVTWPTTKESIYYHVITEIIGTVNTGCLEEIRTFLDEKLDICKEAAIHNTISIENARERFEIYNQLKKLL